MSERIFETIAVEVEGSGYELLLGASGQPLVQDLELARWLGFERPRKIRELIARLASSLGEVCPMVGQTSEKGGRPGLQYHLTEAQALFIAAKSETPRATQILKAMIAVFMEARRRLQQLPASPADCGGESWSISTGPLAAQRWNSAPAAPQPDIADHVLPPIPVPTPAALPLHSVRTGTIEIGGLGLGCAILSDGRAVLGCSDFYAAFGRRAHRGHGAKAGEARARLPGVLCRQGVEPFVSRRLPKLLTPIRYQRKDAEPEEKGLLGIDPNAATEVCASILRAVAAYKIHPSSTKAVSSAVKVLAAIAQRPWAARIEEACGGTTALARPAPSALAAGHAAAPPAERDPYEAIADAVFERMRRARRLPLPSAARMSSPAEHELRTRLANIEMMLLEQAARAGDL